MNNSLRRSLFCSTAMMAFAAIGSHGAMAQSGASVLGGGSTLAYPTVNQEFATAIAGSDFTYCSVSSGAGTSAFVSNSDAPLVADTTNCNGVTGQTVDYGASDAFISAADVSDFASNAHAGPLIQIPIFGTPITFPFKLAGDTTNGSLTLTESQICGIFSGQITDWHTIVSTIASGATIKVVYRLDGGSGTTFLLTSHLKTVCPLVNASAFTTTQLAAMPTAAFAVDLFPSGVPANFSGATYSSGVETFVKNTSHAIGYVGPDYTAISVIGNSAGAPVVASVVNHNDATTYLPNVVNATTGLGPFPVPVGAAEAVQSNWAPQALNPAHGYPVVGWTYWFLATCYNKTTSAGVASDLISFLQEHYNVSNTTGGHVSVDEVTNGGFVPITGSTANAPAIGFAAAINNVFLVGDGQRLNIANTGAGSTNLAVCATLAGR